MNHEKQILFQKILTIIYLLTTTLSFLFLYEIILGQNLKSIIINTEYAFLLVNVFIIWYFLILLFDLTKFHRLRTRLQMFFDHAIVVGIGVLSISMIVLIFKLDSISRIFIFTFAPVNLLSLSLGRYLTDIVIRSYRSNGGNASNLMIIADDFSDEIIQKYIYNKHWGYNIKVIITDSERITEKYIMNYAVLPMNTNIDKFLEIETIDEVIYCKTDYQVEEVQHLIFSCQEVGVTFHLLSQVHRLIASKSRITNIDNMAFFTFSKSLSHDAGIFLKQLFDFSLSLIVIILFSPFLLLIALLIKLTSEGPVLYKQKRVGLHGRLFDVYKFRTMVDHADEMKAQLLGKNEQDGPVFKIKNDPRITKIGKFLRKTSLDEFPQFFNVLKCNMSIVGPRPPIPDEVKQYERWQLRRLSMKPGITCIWQVSGRNKVSFNNWMKMDIDYIDHWSLKLDFIISLRTIQTILKLNGQ